MKTLSLIHNRLSTTEEIKEVRKKILIFNKARFMK